MAVSRDPTPKPPTRGGASQSKADLHGQIQAWWNHHHQSAYSSLARLLASPLQTLMTALVVAIAMALPATLMIALDNIQRLGDHFDSKPKITVYLRLQAQTEAIEQLQRTLRSIGTIESLEYISPDEALATFQSESGFGDILKVLDTNPLPPTLIVTPTPAASPPAELQQLVELIASESIVDQVGIDLEWIKRLQAIMAVGQQLAKGLALLLSLGVLIALGNTIRLAIESRRDEIVIIKLVGGTDGFVRRPFLYTGAWYGLLGGILACLLVGLGVVFLRGPVRALAGTYQSDFRLQGLGIEDLLSLLAISTLLGLMGAWLAVGRHLREIEPH
jgi:cell division transport system permease protein